MTAGGLTKPIIGMRSDVGVAPFDDHGLTTTLSLGWLDFRPLGGKNEHGSALTVRLESTAKYPVKTTYQTTQGGMG